MDNKKFAFIICTNNELLLNECLNYIELLSIPDGYTIDVLTIPNATCMTSGYNEGMNSSDAKYKIYMHQDVFIINTNFLYDIISIFDSDEKIGLIGMVGYRCVALTGSMWHEERFGIKKLFGTRREYPFSNYSHGDYESYVYDLEKDGFQEVSLIDGLMMITAYDIPWDVSTLKDWDFYDAFQSINYLEHHYKIVVPNQNYPWIIHDDGRILTMWNYNKYRKLFMEKYDRYLGLDYNEIRALN